MKLNLKDLVLDGKGKEEFLEEVEQFTDVFSLRDEIGTCPFIEVHLKLKDETPFFVRLYPMREEQKKVIQKEMDRLKHLGIIRKGLTGYSSLVVLVKWKNQNLYQVCSDFHILNEKLVKINHAFPLVRDCIEQLDRKKCHYLNTIDLRDAFHTLQLALSSQKYCGITPYYGSPTYHYLCMGMGMSVSLQIWQQFVDLVFQDDLIKRKQNFDVIMDDTFIHSTAEENMDDLMDLFKVLRKYGLKLSPHKCQFFKKKIVYMGLEFQIQGDKVCYTPLKDKCDAIRNLESPKTLRQTRAFCEMVNFLSSFLPNLRRLLIPIYDLQKKAKKFKWTEEAEKASNKIKKLLINPSVLKAPTPDGLFRLKSDTLREGVGGTLLQKQGDEWVVIGYHSKRLPKSAKNFGITEIELTGLLVNIHGFMQLLSNRYFEVPVDHKAIEYMIKSKTESPMTRLRTLLLKLSEYTIELKYQKGSEVHTSKALSRLHNFTDTPDQKDVIPLNFLQHFTPHYIEHSYSYLVENLYAHKTKTVDVTTVKRKCGRPPKPKPQIPTSKPRTMTAAKNLTTQPRQHPRSLNNKVVSRQMINEINAEQEKSDRLTVAKLNAVKQFNKQDHKSKLMTEKYLLLPLNPQQLTPVQTAIQRMSEKHPDFEIEPVNTIQPLEIEYTQMPQAMVPIDTPLSIIHKHIPRQSDIDKIVKNIETCIIHSLELPIQAQDLIKAYQHSTHFHDIYQYITGGKLPSSAKAQNCMHQCQGQEKRRVRLSTRQYDILIPKY